MKPVLKAAPAALALLGLSAAAPPALAQERPNTILVLDASGSMWGQIDGVNKIVIAREAVAGILKDFPADQNLGFVAYGHRQRGQCSDIQTIVEPAPGTAPEIVKIVNELNPRGMTPMTDAVIAAAQALRHTEQAATVILVSDGIETCNPDPCAAARALEEAGIDFTAHVVGFDVKGEAEALMQMRCIAEETGGRFLTADDAEELTEALQQVVAAPTSAEFSFAAHLSPEPIGPEAVWSWSAVPATGNLVPGEVLWEISSEALGFAAELTGNPVTAELPFGEYVVTAHAAELDMFAQHTDSFAPEGARALTALFPPAEPAPSAVTLTAVMEEEGGPVVETPVVWSLSLDGEGFEIDGNPGEIEVRPGLWRVTGYHVVLEQEKTAELQVVAGEPLEHRMVFEAPAPKAALTAPESAPAGSMLEVEWTGPDAERDNIQIAPVGARYSDFAYTERGNPARLQTPAEPGAYELRYSFRDAETIATRPITITETETTLTAPESAPAGSMLEVEWVGPNASRDNIQIAPVGGGYYDFAYTERGNPARVQLPAKPGAYELRYSFRDAETIATRPITVTEIETSLTAPESAPAGSVIEVEWVGPNASRDNIQIAPVGGRYSDFAYTERGNPARIQLPAEPGAYELRYSFRDSEVIATRPIAVVPAP